MSVSTIEAYVENGQIRMPEDVKLPEKAKVYIVVPGVSEVSRDVHIYSPRLANPDRAKHFRMQVIEGNH